MPPSPAPPIRTPRAGAARVLLVEHDSHVRQTLEQALGEVCNQMGAILEVTSHPGHGLDLLRTHGDWALVLAGYDLEDMPGSQFLRSAMVLQPAAIRILFAEHPSADHEGPDPDQAFRILVRPVQPTAIAGFAAEALRLHLLDRQRHLLVREMGLKAERLERRRKLLDVVVRERTRELEQALSRLHVAGRQAIAGLAEAMEVHDGYQGHGTRVAASARSLAERLGLPAAEIESLELGAFLHDIGKVGVRDKVLWKPGPLSEEEWQLVRIHPTVGADIVGKIEMLRDVAATIRHCREHWDGSGYPDGLGGDRIPTAARILAVADAFDALACDRPYRKALSREACYTAIRDRTGTWFDPRLVDMFIAHRLG